MWVHLSLGLTNWNRGQENLRHLWQANIKRPSPTLLKSMKRQHPSGWTTLLSTPTWNQLSCRRIAQTRSTSFGKVKRATSSVAHKKYSTIADKMDEVRVLFDKWYLTAVLYPSGYFLGHLRAFRNKYLARCLTAQNCVIQWNARNLTGNSKWNDVEKQCRSE